MDYDGAHCTHKRTGEIIVFLDNCNTEPRRMSVNQFCKVSKDKTRQD